LDDYYAGLGCTNGFMSGTVTTMQCTGIVQEMVVRRTSFTITASLYKDGIRMNNYYYDAPPDFTPGDEAQIVVPMEQPPEGYVYSSYFASSAIFRKRGCKMLSRGLPVRVGTRVGIREPWEGETCKHCGRDFRLVWSIPDLCWLKLPIIYHNRCLCLECAIYLISDLKLGDVTITGIARENIYWYTATAVNVVKQDGQWVEKVTIRRCK
jgi:hypothetical protein